jgi:hypothetical protein
MPVDECFVRDISIQHSTRHSAEPIPWLLEGWYTSYSAIVFQACSLAATIGRYGIVEVVYVYVNQRYVHAISSERWR